MRDPDRDQASENERANQDSRRAFLKRVGAIALGAPRLPTWTQALRQPSGAGRPRIESAAWRDTLVTKYRDGCGYEHCQINDYWAQECRTLPCFDGVCWTKDDALTAASGSYYAERVLHDVTLPGSSQQVIIHLWKGYCNKFGFSNDSPGGAGAEVGVYLHRDDVWIAKNSTENAMRDGILWRTGAGWAALGITSTPRSASQKWFPAPELKAKLRFELVDPENANTIVAASDRMAGGYWCTDWMIKESYDKYSKTRTAYIEDGVPEIDPVELTLRWWLNGSRMPDWVYAPRDKSCHINRGYV